MILGKLFFRLCGALFVGLIIALYILQHNQQFKAFVQEEFVATFEKLFDCTVQAKLTNLQLLSPEIILENITVTDKKNHAWSWRCKQATCSFSWLSLLLYPRVPLDIVMVQVRAYSEYKDNQVAIADHLKKIIEEPLTLPVSLHTISWRKTNLLIHDKDHDIQIILPMDAQAGSFDKRLKATFTIDGAHALYNKTTLCKNVTASLQASLDETTKQSYTTVALKGSGELVTPAKIVPCYITGRWNTTNGTLQITSTDETVQLEQTITLPSKKRVGFSVRTYAQAPLELLASCLPQLNGAHVHGMTTLTHDFTYNTTSKQSGTIHLKDIAYNANKLGNVTGYFKQTDTGGEAMVHASPEPFGSICGLLTYNHKKKLFNCDLTNNKSLILWPSKYWTLYPHTSTLQITNTSDGISAQLKAREEHALTHAQGVTVGTITTNKTLCKLHALHNTYTIDADITVSEKPSIKKVTITDAQKKPLFTFDETKQDTYQGSIPFAFLKQLISSTLDSSVSGSGICNINLTTSKNSIKGNLNCENASIRLLQTYNVIDKLKAEFELNTQQQHVTLKNGLLHTHKGRIFTDKALFHFDTESLTPSFIHAPCIIDNLLLTAEKRIFVVISGSLLMLKQQNAKPTLRGNVILERGQIKRNIFANTLTKNFLDGITSSYGTQTNDCEIDIHLAANNPLQVKTPFLEAQIKPRLDIKGSVQHPSISGTVSILDGTLAFPYKPLHITHGHLYFMPQHMYDPRIELVAKGKIRKYSVTMRINGSIKQPVISFESTPRLNEEQIITLILAGSEEGSFPLVMPTLIMHNFQQLLFGPEPTESALERTFKNLLAPLKSISIVPSFDDQTGRGGLRGAIEIGVNERLSGKIQKNFSLSEDTRFEVEYLLSDDISIRGTKDERGDVGGELEMRWKF